MGSARRCGIRIDGRTLGREEVEAACPFCGDKPDRYHLSMNTRKNQYHCKLCGAGGNSVSLYARLQDVSYTDAARELIRGNIYKFPQPPQAPPAETGIKPLAERHGAYYEMLSHLALNDRHLRGLRDRGLPDERIGVNMYRTLPKDGPERRFLAGMLAGFYDLSGIPGFCTGKDGQWTIAGKGGLLIPVCDKDGYIQGMQVRLDDWDMEPGANGAGRRYRWLSSRYSENGAGSAAWIHVTGDITSKTAYLTEGPLKGDVASFLGGDALFICVAGINATGGLADVIKSLGITELVIASDMDKEINPQVREGTERIAKAVSGIKGVRVFSLDWDARYKGIDDYYLALRKAAA